MSKVVGIRGAITVEENTKESIYKSVKELIDFVREYNGFSQDDIVSAVFSTTKDINALFPASAARKLGWSEVPLLDVAQMDVPGSMTRVIRLLIHINVKDESFKPKHAYLRDAAKLRPDLSE